MRFISIIILLFISLNCFSVILPKNPFILLRYGQRYLKKAHYSLAISCFKKATELGLRSSRLLSDLGRAYYKSKKFKKAIIAFSQVLEIDPADLFALQMRALVRLRIFQLRLAKQDLDTAYLLQPHSAFNCSLYGRYYKIKLQYKLSYYWFRKSLYYKKNYFGYLAAGKSALKLKLYKQARDHFFKAVGYTTVSKNREYLQQMAILSFYKLAVKLKRQGKVKVAWVMFKNIQKMYPQSRYAKLAGRELEALRYLAQLRGKNTD